VRGFFVAKKPSSASKCFERHAKEVSSYFKSSETKSKLPKMKMMKLAPG